MIADRVLTSGIVGRISAAIPPSGGIPHGLCCHRQYLAVTDRRFIGWLAIKWRGCKKTKVKRLALAVVIAMMLIPGALAAQEPSRRAWRGVNEPTAPTAETTHAVPVSHEQPAELLGPGSSDQLLAAAAAPAPRQPPWSNGRTPPTTAALNAQDIAGAQRQGTKAKGRFTGLLLTDSGRAVANGIFAALAAMDNHPVAQGPYGTGFAISVFTPPTWLAQHVGNALREYRPFDVNQLDPDFFEPVLRVTGIPDLPTYVTGRGIRAADSVKRVVVTDEERRLIIQPATQSPYDQTVSSAFRDANFSGVVVTFPLDGVDAVRRLSPKGEFLIIVVGYGSEKVFKVKTKHFDSIPYHVQ